MRSIKNTLKLYLLDWKRIFKNPIATILSAAMMLRYSFDLDQEAKDVEDAIEKVLKEGYRTTDIMSEGKTLVGTREMGDLIVSHL